MALTIPDFANASFVEQSGPDSVDFDTILAGFQQYGVIGTGASTVSQRAAGANLSVDVGAGTVLVNGAVFAPSATNVAITADATNPRWVMITVDSAGTVAATLGTAAATPVMPSVIGKTVLAAVWVPASAASILNANIVDKRVVLKSAPATTVQSGTSFGVAPAIGTSFNYALQDHQHGTPSTPVTSAVAGTGIGVSGATGAVTISNTGATSVAGRTGAVALTAADIAAGTFPGANSFTGLQTMNAGLTIPSGETLTVGVKKTLSGTASLATANTAAVLGQFSSTSGAVALRLHLSLVTGTVTRTKTFEFVVDTSTDTTNTYYKLLAADQSSVQTTSNDFLVVCYRPSTATTTWQFWVCSTPTFAASGTVTWSAETYGDTVVTYAAALSPATAAPTLPLTAVAHPSNYLSTVAGNVGIGTDSPSFLLHSQSGTWMLQNAGAGVAAAIGVTKDATAVHYLQSAAAGVGFSDSALNDMNVLAAAGTTLRLGVFQTGPLASTLRITSSDAQINDSGTARTLPRGKLGEIHLTANAAQNITTTVTTINGTASLNNATAAAQNLALTFNAVAGRTYMILFNGGLFSSVAGDTLRPSLVVSTNPGGTLVSGPGPLNVSAVAASTVYPFFMLGFFYCTVTGSATIAGQMVRAGGTGNTNASTGTMLAIHDMGI